VKSKGPDILTHCNFCRAKLPAGLVYFCSDHWWLLPAHERASVQQMHTLGRDMETKLAKCVRLLRSKRPCVEVPA